MTAIRKCATLRFIARSLTRSADSPAVVDSPFGCRRYCCCCGYCWCCWCWGGVVVPGYSACYPTFRSKCNVTVLFAKYPSTCRYIYTPSLNRVVVAADVLTRIPPPYTTEPHFRAGPGAGANRSSARCAGQHSQGRQAHPATHGHAPSRRAEEAVDRGHTPGRRRRHRPPR